ncbi:hypothetical protein PG994_004745 [Apiospora phragmitis]|uniref:Anaphase-promoting complex subunit 5 n=1 Tax=Apiospora phragmitis TaxID=2905665 RepID=A0ABR1VRG1_9PEZI
MSRFLTPAKIGLLALIELHIDKAVPTSSIVDVLSFITSHLIDREISGQPANGASRWEKAERTVSLVISIADFEKVLSPHTAASGMPGRSLWYVFLDKLWKINSLDALHEFFERRSELLVKTKEELRRNTELGVTPPARRLRFHDALDLWKDFVKYRQTTAAFYRKKTPSFQRLSFDNVLLEGEMTWGCDVEAVASVAYGDMLRDDPSSTLPVSTDDIEKLLEFQIEQMQKYGNRIPQEIYRQFHDLLNDSYMVPSLSHYLSYLDAWRAGDYSTSFDYLHKYFDYTMQHRDRLFYQYALMNLAVLQADFGCHKEAVSAMLETVSTARENRDITCLNFALNWLFHFGRAHPEVTRELESNSMLGTGKESLAFLRSKAKETGMWTLWSSALVSEAKMTLSNGESIATALEHMVRSSQILIERNMKSSMGNQLALSIALWDRLGISYLSSTTCEIFLRCHARHTIFDDELKVTCRQASMLALKGKYDEALEKLEKMNTNSLRAWKANQYWHKFRRLLSQLLQSKDEDLEPDLAFVIDSLHIECLIRRGNLEEAFAKVEGLVSELRDEHKDIALRVRLLLIKAELLDRCGRPQKGFTIAIRAANVAWRARLIPYLWPAIGAVANIINSLGDFEPAIQLLMAVLPRSLECENSAMTAKLYSFLGDAYMGMAGTMPAKSHKRREYMTKASEAIEKAFNHYSSMEDINKQCEMMAKRATIMKISGENQLANDLAAAYLVLRRDAALLKD